MVSAWLRCLRAHNLILGDDVLMRLCCVVLAFTRCDVASAIRLSDHIFCVCVCQCSFFVCFFCGAFASILLGYSHWPDVAINLRATVCIFIIFIRHP